MAIRKENGYIALISAVIISAVLVIVTFTVSFSNFFARFNILDSEFKKVSVGLAEACVDTAILEIVKDPAWQPPSGGMQVTVGDASKTCKICYPISDSGGQKTLLTRARFQKAITNLEVKVTPNGSDANINSWVEKADYTGTACDI